MHIAGYELKQVDFFSGLKPKAPKKALPKPKPMPRKPGNLGDSCATNMVCWEDYSDGRAATFKLFEALAQSQAQNQKFRIAFFGDSFVEGDMFCGDIRQMLQDTFGGHGVGFMPITTEAPRSRANITHDFSGFNTFTAVQSKARSLKFLAAGGYFFTPQAGNYVQYKASNYRHLNSFQQIKLFYLAQQDSLRFQYSTNQKARIDTVRLKRSGMMEVFELPQRNCNNIWCSFQASDSLKLYGLSFEGGKGVYLDNFGLRGNSGRDLLNIPKLLQQRFNQFQNYQFVILQYGLNVATPKDTNFKWYEGYLREMIVHAKACYPNACILLMSVSDRSVNEQGSFVTMPSIPILVETQRRIAKESKIVFWDLYSAMGGENSMTSFVEQTPALANKDYTHINFRGGAKLGGIFVETFLFEYEKYQQLVKRLQL
jgi:hypothetical protein